MRPELVRLSQEIAGVHRDMFARQASLRSVLSELGDLPVEKRIPRQQEFMQHSEMEKMQMDLLREKLKGLQDLRQEKISELNKLRIARETLEKLREKARQKHNMAMRKLEQKELDESSRLIFGRELADRRVSAVD
jgi:hypothetical protein